MVKRLDGLDGEGHEDGQDEGGGIDGTFSAAVGTDSVNRLY